MRSIKQKGFTVTEIVITLVIIAVLTLLIMPAYNNYQYRARRSDAFASIAAIQAAEERYRALNTSTTYGTLAQIGSSTTSINGYYTMAITAASNTATAYTITATATGAQASDTNCAVFTFAFANGSATKSSSPDTTCWNQ